MILKGEKVVLRPIILADAPRFVKWFNDPEFNKFMNIRSTTLEQEKRWIKDLSKKKKTDLALAIETSAGVHIGSTGLHQINLTHKHATFGIMIGNKKYWNRGYGTDAAKTILDYGFLKLKLHRIDLGVYEYNHRAMNVYKKLGFKIEGKMREFNLYKSQYYNDYHMSILDREWKTRSK